MKDRIKEYSEEIQELEQEEAKYSELLLIRGFVSELYWARHEIRIRIKTLNESIAYLEDGGSSK
jgi:hypothetical protein